MGNKKKILTRKVYPRVTPETYRCLDEIKANMDLIESMRYCKVLYTAFYGWLIRRVIARWNLYLTR